MLAVFLILINTSLVFAASVEDWKAPDRTGISLDADESKESKSQEKGAKLLVLSAEVVTEGSQPGLYITVGNLPKDTDSIMLNYSFNGKDYFLRPEGDWYAEDLGTISDGVTLFACGLDEYPLHGYLTGQVENLFLQVHVYYQSDLSDSLDSEPFQFSHNRTYEVPQKPPPFLVDVKFGWWTYSLYGRFSDFPPNVDYVLVTYSWNDIEYQSINPHGQMKWYLQNLGHPDPVEREKLEHLEIGTYMDEPMKSFLAFERDTFYVKLEIHTLDGQIYDSQPAKYTREERQPLPAHLTPRIAFGFNVLISKLKYENSSKPDQDGNYPIPDLYTHGQYQMTVREDATPTEIEAALPDTLPVRVFLWDKKTNERYSYADLQCGVDWKRIPSLSLTAGKPVAVTNAAKPLVIPAGTNIETLLGTYILKKPLTFKGVYDSDKIRLVLNPIAVDAQPKVVLRACDRALLAESGEGYYQKEGDEDVLIGPSTPLSVIFPQKPTGATTVNTYAVVGDERIALGDLLESKPVNYNQSCAGYGDIAVLQPEDYPYSAYLAGEIDKFSIEVSIEGGIFDGMTQSASWPGKYTLPPVLPTEGGNAGNENNAGYEEIEEDDSGDNDGQRPDLPKEESVPLRPPQQLESGHEIPNPPALSNNKEPWDAGKLSADRGNRLGSENMTNVANETVNGVLKTVLPKAPEIQVWNKAKTKAQQPSQESTVEAAEQISSQSKDYPVGIIVVVLLGGAICALFAFHRTK